MVNTVLFGYLTAVSLLLTLAMAFFATIHVTRLRRRTPTAFSQEIGSTKAVMHKVRKREPMTHEEVDYARQVITDRTSVLALCIPGALFMVGCFFVFGSLEHLHGATPSERTFLGLIPMLTSTNLALRMLSGARLKRRLP
jgi:hypothetical protein